MKNLKKLGALLILIVMFTSIGVMAHGEDGPPVEPVPPSEPCVECCDGEIYWFPIIGVVCI